MKIKRLLSALGLASFGLFIALWGISTPSPAVAGLPAAAEVSAIAQTEAREVATTNAPVPNPGWIVTANNTGDKYGAATALADIDQDDITDYIVSAPEHNTGYGIVAIHLSNGLKQPAVTPSIQLSKGEAGDEFGASLSIIDISDDGSPDLLMVGAPGAGSAGAVYIYEITGGSVVATPVAELLGTDPGERFGAEVAHFMYDSSGKFVNFMVGAPLYDNGGNVDVGRALFYTATEGAYTNVNNQLAWKAVGTDSNGNFGSAIAPSQIHPTGENDLPDIFVGAPNENSDTGKVYFYSMDVPGDLPIIGMAANVERNGAATGSLFGTSIIAGDVTADGVIDLIMGEPGYVDDNGERIGRVFIETSYASGFASREPNPVLDIELFGTMDDSLFGTDLAYGSLKSTNTQCGDLFVGAPNHTFKEANEGGVFVFAQEAVGSGNCYSIQTEATMLFASNNANANMGASIAANYIISSVIPSRATESNLTPGMLFGAPNHSSSTGLAIGYQGNRSDAVAGGIVMTTPAIIPTGWYTGYYASATYGGAHLYWWDFGENSHRVTESGSYTETSAIGHAYSKAGDYTITLKVLSPNGLPQTFTRTIKVVDPIVGLSIEADIADAGKTTSFTATVQSSGDPFTYKVLFGDEIGSARVIVDPYTYYPNQTAGSFNFTHTYSAVGIYNMVVIATNDTNTIVKNGYVRVRNNKVLTPGIGGTFGTDITGSQKVTITIPGSALSETIELKITPIEEGCGEISAPTNSIGNCFDIDVEVPGGAVRHTADEEIRAATATYCIYLPLITGGGGSGSSSSSSTSGCTPLAEDVYEFLEPVTITISYGDSDLRSIDDESTLEIHYYNTTTGTWINGATTCPETSKYTRDTLNNTITVQICHQSRWGFAGR